VTAEELCNQAYDMPRRCKVVIKIKDIPQNINTRNALEQFFSPQPMFRRVEMVKCPELGCNVFKTAAL